MNLSEVLAPIKAHPGLVIGGALGVVGVVWLVTHASSASAASAAPAASTASAASTSDPYMDSLIATQNTNATNLAIAQIQAQTTSTVNQQNNATAASAAVINAQVENAQVGASMFSTAAQALSTNYDTQLSYASGTGGASDTYTGASSLPYGIIGGTPGGVWEGSGGINNAVGTKGGAMVPTYAYETSTTGANDPAAVNEINTANTQLEEMFNNVLRAGQGIAPVQNNLVTTGSQSSTTGSYVQTGTEKYDPVFVGISNTGALPTITDITPGASNSYGYTGSEFDPGTGQRYSFA